MKYALNEEHYEGDEKRIARELGFEKGYRGEDRMRAFGSEALQPGHTLLRRSVRFDSMVYPGSVPPAFGAHPSHAQYPSGLTLPTQLPLSMALRVINKWVLNMKGPDVPASSVYFCGLNA